MLNKDVNKNFSGKVYNITPYMEYHPGGEEELMRGAGIDGTQLFDEVWSEKFTQYLIFFHKKIKVFALVTSSNIPEIKVFHTKNVFYILLGIGKLIGLLIIFIFGFIICLF